MNKGDLVAYAVGDGSFEYGIVSSMIDNETVFVKYFDSFISDAKATPVHKLLVVEPVTNLGRLKDLRTIVMRNQNPLFTPPNKDATLNALLGLSGETGEILDLFKKQMFQGHQYDTVKLMSEIGDVLYYLQLLCWTQEITLEQCIETVVNKLMERYPDGFSSARSINRNV